MARQTRKAREHALAEFFADNPSKETQLLSVLERIESHLYELGESVPELIKAIKDLKAQIYLSGGPGPPE